MTELSDYIKIFVGLVAIVNPLGVIPLFISMTANQGARELRKTIQLVPIGVAVILLVSLFVGQDILHLFGITIDAFRVGGGILILLMAISMLNAKTSDVKQTGAEADESIAKESVAIVPLAMPLLAGPGAISTVIIASQSGGGLQKYLPLSVAIVLLSLLIYGILRLSPWIARRISKTGLNIFTRVMGLILAAIAIEFIAAGITGLFPALGQA
jgi:multiple antibiotic resistance protein